MIKLYWYITGYIRKHGLKFLLAALIGAGFFSLVLPYLFRNFSHKQTYYIGLVGEYDLMNLPEDITRQLSRGLVRMDETGVFDRSSLDLASRFALENNGKRFRFTLEDDLVWPDGQPFVATDVNYRLREAQVTYEGNEVIYDLPAVLASFPQLLTKPILRYQEEKKYGFINHVEVYGLKNSRLTSYRWQDRSHSALSQVVIDDLETHIRYVYRFYYTQNQALDAYKLGKIDYLPDITNVEEVKDWVTTTVQERRLTDQYLAVFFNTSDPLLTRNVRQALSYAVEKERPGFDRAISPINPNCFAYFPGVKRYDKNIDSGVERLLDELPGAPINIELVTTVSYYDIASRIKEDWEELGEAAVAACQESDDIENKDMCEYLHIQTNIQIQTIPDTNHFQTMLIGQQIPLDPDQYNLWHSDLATNFTHYKNTRVDNSLEKARQSIDASNPERALSSSERATRYQEFQQDLLEDPPAIFLWYLQSWDLYRGDDVAVIDISRVGRHQDSAPTEQEEVSAQEEIETPSAVESDSATSDTTESTDQSSSTAE